MKHPERSWLALAGLVLMLAGSLPHLIAWAATPAHAHFTGLVYNPLDGNSYLAKMRQGFDGSWRFHLPFTSERSSGAHIFLFHLWLGHLARWTGTPLIAVYHATRVLGGAVMLVAIYALTSRLSGQRRERGTMFLLTAIGSGLGWLLTTLGIRTADVWVPEAFPAYSLLANAHFPLAIGLMATIVFCGLHILGAEAATGNQRAIAWPWALIMTLATILLSAIQPFGLMPVFGGLGIALVARAAISRREQGSTFPWRSGAWVVAAAATALPYPLYVRAAIDVDPRLAAWNAQNVTASPPPWDWVLSYGLLSVLAVWGGRAAIRRGSDADFTVVGWGLATFAGMYLPLPLQRRLSIGLGVPMGLLAGLGWWLGARKLVRARDRSLAQGLIIAFSALTPIFLIATASVAALRPEAAAPDSWLYLSDGEWAALGWLRQRAETREAAVVLCAPQTGSFVPAWSGQRVVYGHPFETVNAEQRQDQVTAYWSGAMSPSEQAGFLDENRVEYILIGPRERLIGAGEWASGEVGRLVFEADNTRIYELNGQ